MSSIVVEGLGKRFRVGGGERHNTLRDALNSAIRRSGRAKGVRNGSAAASEFWALRDITFDVAEGEPIGIIGPNGAGKSTLLKILSRITEPTTGLARVRGRVGSLLEVGTGFHSELTGRENVFLSGAILGMRWTEIQRKFDEIIAFSEVERFIDTPVKHFSSGMYLRLAFAVAAHLEPEILVVDEVLAVGDAEFQRKCIEKMQSLTQDEGRTVLFVSHDMRAMRRLCSRCILLSAGRIDDIGEAGPIIQRYLRMGGANTLPGARTVVHGHGRHTGSIAYFTAASFHAAAEGAADPVETDGPVTFVLDIEAAEPVRVGSLAVTFYDLGGTKLVNADLFTTGETLALQPGSNVVRVRIESLHLQPGHYPVGMWLADVHGNVLDHQEHALYVEVVHPHGALRLRPQHDGAVSCDLAFTVEPGPP